MEDDHDNGRFNFHGNTPCTCVRVCVCASLYDRLLCVVLYEFCTHNCSGIIVSVSLFSRNMPCPHVAVLVPTDPAYVPLFRHGTPHRVSLA